MPDAAESAEVVDARIFDVVKKLFDEQINPMLNMHGGFARLVRVEGRRVQVELGGGCRGCPGARMTMKRGVETMIREVAPEVDEVVDVTDHGL